MLKKQFTTEPILIIFDPTKPIMLETNASDLALGAVISQQVPDRKWHPVALYSRNLTIPEQNYKIHNKELLAIVNSIKYWRIYLKGSRHQVQVYLDYKKLVYFTTTKELNWRQVQWSKELAQYNFKITHRKGSKNAKADALSQKDDYMRNVPKTKNIILWLNQFRYMKYNHWVIATL